MKEKLLIQGESLQKPVGKTLAAELFLNTRYHLRRNVLNGKLEFAPKTADEPSFRPLTQLALNSIILQAKREAICGDENPKSDIVEYVNSEDVIPYNPIQEYLNDLPQWDGQNHVAALFNRIPGVTSEQLSFLSVWFRSAVLIGAQGCGKTTFLRRMLPPHLRQYYLDHLNLSNKFDKEMALTNNLLVNLDELEAIRPSQQAALKQTLSKSKVNGRPIYGASQEDRPRYASFVATTNNRHPLKDITGSRRYICLSIPDGQIIDNAGDIDYEQLYAQAVYELQEQQAPFWFNNDEVARIQELNLEYMEQKDIADLITACFRKPIDGEEVKTMNSTQILSLMQKEYPSLKINHSTRIHLGQAMKELEFEHTEHSHVAFYKVIPIKAA